MKPALALALALGVLPLAGCYQVGAAGKTNRIELVGSSVVDGYKFDQYRNLSYPCSISGYQTFVIGTKVGSSDTQTRPLWVRMRGGGVGYFDSNGKPQPSAGNKSEESAATSIGFVRDTGLMALVRADAAGVPAAVGVDVRPRHLLRRRSARPQQPEHAARRVGPHGQRAVRDQGGDPVRAREVPDRQVLPARDERRLGGRLSRLLGPAAAGHPARRLGGGLGPVNIEWEIAQHEQGVCPAAARADPRRWRRSRPARSIRAGQHQERARQAGQPRRADRAAAAHVEQRRPEHLRRDADVMPAA